LSQINPAWPGASVHIFLTARGRALKRRLVPPAEEVNRIALKGAVREHRRDATQPPVDAPAARAGRNARLRPAAAAASQRPIITSRIDAGEEGHMSADAGVASPKLSPRILVAENGPYYASAVTLTVRAPVLNEHGEAVDWKGGEVLPTRPTHVLCRCGESGNKPYCDGTHRKAGFDGRCTADRAPGATRRKAYEGAGVTMTDDESLCAGYAFCDPHGGVWREIAQTADPVVKQRLQRQIADCPSGRLQYSLAHSSAPVEQHYEPTIAAIPDGPLWVLGGVPVEATDGFTYELRNRQLLCRCGASLNKPFCDGSHRRVGFKAR
jgi:CDGSH-type Zn-finger protein